MAKFEKAAMSMRKGRVSKPVKTRLGWHIIKLEDRRPAQAAPFETVKARIKQNLVQQAIKDHLDELWNDAGMEIVDEKA